jgi:hypothetical protein
MSLCGRNRLKGFENKVQRRIYSEWRKLYNEELHNLYLHLILLGRLNQDGEVGGTCSTRQKQETIQNLSWRTSRLRTTRQLRRKRFRWEDKAYYENYLSEDCELWTD